MKILINAVLLMALILNISGCSEDDTEDIVAVLSEEVIFTSGEVVMITGRILSTGSIDIADHGFEVSLSENFEDTIKITLGARDIPGQFIGRNESLTPGTEYFARAYMVYEGNTEYGEAIQFTTLSEDIFNFEPDYAFAGQTLEIFGRNLTKDSKIYFGENEAEILEFDFEAYLKVRIPAPSNGAYNVPIRIVSENAELEFEEDFEYAIGLWKKVAELPEKINLEKNAYFKSNDKLFFGVGEESIYPVERMWYFNPGDNTFSEIPYEGPVSRSPFSFDGGFGSGVIQYSAGNNEMSMDVWVADENDNLQLETEVLLGVSNAVAYRSGDDLYLFGGRLFSNANSSQIYKYSFVEKSWNAQGVTPFDVTDKAASFEYQGMYYFMNPNSGEIHKYSPESNTWEYVSTYPAQLGDNLIGQVIGNSVIMGLGTERRDIWSLDLVTGQWKSKTGFIGFNRESTVGIWKHNELLYILRTNNALAGASNGQMEMYTFDPNNY